MTYDPSSASGVVPSEDRNWAMGAHLSAFLAAYIALGFLGPLVVLLVRGDRSQFVRQHAAEALNFNLTVLIWIAISVILIIVGIGILMLVAVGILYVVTVIIGAIRASSGEHFRYPLTIRFVK
jgi:uncharacterized Tic20 family protein